MPKYLWKSSYTAEGARGLAARGGSARREVVQNLVEGLGGELEAFYFAFGDTDVYVIADLPDDAAAAAVSLAVNSAGASTVTTVPLLESELLDSAAQRSVDYTPPGG
jgi:uncharacterized protein with GYD domain